MTSFSRTTQKQLYVFQDAGRGPNSLCTPPPLSPTSTLWKAVLKYISTNFLFRSRFNTYISKVVKYISPNFLFCSRFNTYISKVVNYTSKTIAFLHFLLEVSYAFHRKFDLPN